MKKLYLIWNPDGWTGAKNRVMYPERWVVYNSIKDALNGCGYINKAIYEVIPKKIGTTNKHSKLIRHGGS